MDQYNRLLRILILDTHCEGMRLVVIPPLPSGVLIVDIPLDLN